MGGLLRSWKAHSSEVTCLCYNTPRTRTKIRVLCPHAFKVQPMCNQCSEILCTGGFGNVLMPSVIAGLRVEGESSTLCLWRAASRACSC